MSEYVVLYEQADNGDWGAYLPDLPGVVALGDTREEVENLIKEAVAAAVEWDLEQGRPPPPPMHQAGTLRVQVPA